MEYLPVDISAGRYTAMKKFRLKRETYYEKGIYAVFYRIFGSYHCFDGRCFLFFRRRNDVLL